jgi:prepilin-type N-terminal cleavage/methylation domain-containing protein
VKVRVNKYSLNQRGFTLLEVLLSILLMTVILTSFLGFFTQSAFFTRNNGDKLSTSQIAQEIVSLIDSEVTIEKLKTKMIIDENNNINSSKKTVEIPELEKLIGHPINSPYSITVTFSKNAGLVQAHVVISSDENESETYTFIRR